MLFYERPVKHQSCRAFVRQPRVRTGHNCRLCPRERGWACRPHPTNLFSFLFIIIIIERWKTKGEGKPPRFHR